MASIKPTLDRTRYKDEHQLPLARLEAELRLAQERPAEALAVVQDALDRFDVLRSPRYGWPLLGAGARACAAAAGDRALLAGAAALRDRLRTAAEKLAAEGLAQRAHQLTFTAETASAGEVPGGARAAWDDAAQAWEAAAQPYPLAAALLRVAEAALSAGDREAGALARDLGAAPLSGDVALVARRARISLSPGHERAPAGGGRRLRRSPGPRARAGAHGPRIRGAPAHRGRAEQPGDRRRAVHLREDRQRARVQHSRQARRDQPR